MIQGDILVKCPESSLRQQPFYQDTNVKTVGEGWGEGEKKHSLWAESIHRLFSGSKYMWLKGEEGLCKDRMAATESDTVSQREL